MPRRKPKDPNRSPDMPVHWIERHLQRVEAYMYTNLLTIDNWKYRTARLVNSGDYQFEEKSWKTIHLGDTWGGKDITAFFRKTIDIPDSLKGENLYFSVSMDGGETQLSINGRPWQGLDCYRSLVPLKELGTAQGELQLDMEAFIINYPYDARRGDEKDFHCFKQFDLVSIHKQMESFLYDAKFALDMYKCCLKHNNHIELESFLLHHLEETCRYLGPSFTHQEQALHQVQRAQEYLHTTVFKNKAFTSQGTLHLCGHSHLDLVYLWPIKETFRKNSRTATNMLSLMREYGEFKFSASQPFLFEKMKEMHPKVFEEIKQRVKEGRWEVTGAMYVEPDGNLLGAESLVRQILFGKKFYREEFGVETETCWLPDVFGVMYTLPQILKKSGIQYFSSIKLNIWNDTNDFPHTTFKWRGPDGSEVLAYFPPTHFAVPCDPEHLRTNWKEYKEKNSIGESLFLYGWADGGGGPTREMVEASLRAKDFPGLPKGEFSFVDDYLKRIHTSQQKLPVWDDELYLEAHRGTYTTKGNLKRLNRKGEILYRNAEIVSAIAGLFSDQRVQEELNSGWKCLLVNQFHDTLPGTHIPEATPDIQKDYQHAFAMGESVLHKALHFLKTHISAGSDTILLFNTLSWKRSEPTKITIPRDYQSIQLHGTASNIPLQHYNQNSWFHIEELPTMGWTTAQLSKDATQNDQKTATFDEKTIETDFYTLTLGAQGEISSLVDKENQREVFKGSGNLFQVFEDDPGHTFSGWDIAYHFEEYTYPVELETPWQIESNGPVFALFKAEWKVLNSTISQEMMLFKKSRRIDFHTQVDWQDSKKLLKVAFFLNIRTRRAVYDLPFGNIDRPTHRNTSWDQAKFEVCGHKWADMSESHYGVALLNDCKYGYDALDNVLRLSLLRSPVRPDPYSDLGQHEFSYALLPHTGSWSQASVDKKAYEFNIPILSTLLDNTTDCKSHTNSLPAIFSLIESEAEGIIVEALKQAEDGKGLILRSFENHGSQCKALYLLGKKVSFLEETNLLEEQPLHVSEEADSFTSTYGAYEIKTHRLTYDT